MIELKQIRLHLKKSFKLNEKGIIITENNILNKEEYFVKYEEINLEKRIFEKKNKLASFIFITDNPFLYNNFYWKFNKFTKRSF